MAPPSVEPATSDLVKEIEEYLAEHPAAAVLEDGSILFDLLHAKYAVAESHRRCVLQLWSEERNVVRTVLSVQRRAGCLRVMTRRLGAFKPSALELVPSGDRRTPTARDAARRHYLRLLERVLRRSFPDWQADGMRAATDLEHSFGPAYARGRLLRGTTAEAVVGVSSEESGPAVDGILTLGLLWLDHCRERSVGSGAGKEAKVRKGASRHFRGLKLIVPAGAWRTTAERLVWLNHGLAAFELYALDERLEELTAIDFRDSGNVESRLVHAFDAAAALERSRAGIERLMSLLPEGCRGWVEVRAHSAVEVGMLLHGLEFARVRYRVAARSFVSAMEISFGAGANETLLTEESEEFCRSLFTRLFESRRPEGIHTNALFRLQPERWLESRIRLKLEEVLPGRLLGTDGEFLYTQVPAISSGDRGMLDLLTLDRSGRLMVMEVKADDDMHLPLQGLDYWIRVRALNAERKVEGNRETGAFERAGYFGGLEVSSREPKLLLVAPALRIHPSNEIVLRYLAPAVEWELIAVGEHWRRELVVVFRRRAER